MNEEERFEMAYQEWLLESEEGWRPMPLAEAIRPGTGIFARERIQSAESFELPAPDAAAGEISNPGASND